MALSDGQREGGTEMTAMTLGRMGVEKMAMRESSGTEVNPLIDGLEPDADGENAIAAETLLDVQNESHLT